MHYSSCWEVNKNVSLYKYTLYIYQLNYSEMHEHKCKTNFSFDQFVKTNVRSIFSFSLIRQDKHSIGVIAKFAKAGGS